MNVGLIGVLQLIFAESHFQVDPATITSHFVIYILFAHLVSGRQKVPSHCSFLCGLE